MGGWRRGIAVAYLMGMGGLGSPNQRSFPAYKAHVTPLSVSCRPLWVRSQGNGVPSVIQLSLWAKRAKCGVALPRGDAIA